MLLMVGNLCIATNSAQAAFHLMQIEQIIGGVNGDTTAQAIQLRMRSGGQSVLSSSAIRAYDSAGATPVLLDDPTTSVANSALGSRVLIATPNFTNYTDIPVVADFIMDPIPTSYLAAGQVRFTNNNGSTIYWSLSWGGAGFTGSTTGNTANDANGIFGPPVDIALPSTTLQALLFTGAASAQSTTNLADYVLTAGAATFINNAGTSFTLVAPEPPSADFDGDGDIDGNDFLKWQRGESPNPFTSADLELWQEQYDTTPPLSAILVPEPASLTLGVWAMASLAILVARRRSAVCLL